MKVERLKQISSISFNVDNSFLSLINFSCELNINTYEDGTVIYCVNISDRDDGYPIAGDDFEDIKEAIKYLEETCRKYVTTILQTRIETGEWAKKRLADMNEFGMFN